MYISKTEERLVVLIADELEEVRVMECADEDVPLTSFVFGAKCMSEDACKRAVRDAFKEAELKAKFGEGGKQ